MGFHVSGILLVVKFGMSGLSAEPGRHAPYSSDLHLRIIWQRTGMEYSFRTGSSKFEYLFGNIIQCVQVHVASYRKTFKK